MRSALIGAVVGVLGVVGCFTFRTGLTDTASSPQRSGIVWDFIAASGEGAVPSKDIATITHDKAISGVLRATWFRNIRVNGVATPTWGTQTLKGGMKPVVLAGHAPAARDEIAFGPETLKGLHLSVGDRVSVGSSSARTVKVVGAALLPASSHTDYDQSAWMTESGLNAAVRSSHDVSPTTSRTTCWCGGRAAST